jgi:phage terminase large subunit
VKQIPITPYFKPRPYQENIIRCFENPQDKRRRFLLAWPRRAGKDLCAFNLMARAAFRKVGNYFYMAPTFSQCRKIILDSIIGSSGMHFVDHIAKELRGDINVSEMKIPLSNGSLIQLCGSDSYDRLVGTSPRGCVWSEYSLADPLSYQYLSPALRNNDGWAIFISTPRGRNHFYELYEIARNNPETWFCERLELSQTKHIDLETIQQEIKEGVLSQDLFEQEYNCSFSLGVEGSYYSKYLNDMRLKGRINSIPWNPSHKVHTAWDIGYSDCTSIIFFQCIGPNVYLIDSYQANKQGLEHYITHLKTKPYLYGKHIGPHDIKQHDFSTGNTRWEKARQLGVTFTVADRVDIADGIEAVRSALGAKIWIDETNCKQLLHCLESYRQEYDAKRKVYHDKPLHDFASHFSDAMRYLCVSLPRLADGLTPEALERRYQEAMGGNQSHLPSIFRDDLPEY